MESVFFDYNSTTPVAPEALKAMLPYFSDVFANPSGQTSEMSWQSQSAIKKAKTQISELIKCQPNEIVFTSGATESINWVFDRFIEQKKHIYISEVDHDAAFEKVSDYEMRLHFKSNKEGSVNLESFKEGLKKLEPGSLVSFIWAHNELGTVLDLKSLVAEVRKFNLFIHIDATQAIGKIEVDLKELGFDFLSCSAHKFYGPKGVGALIINSKTITGLKPMIAGGGQQSGLRSGTLNTPLIVGFGHACELVQERLSDDQKHFKTLRDLFLNELKDVDFTENGNLKSKLLNTVNITFHDWKSLAPLHLELLPFSLSQSSACSSEGGKHRVLNALNIPETGTLRISFGRASNAQNTLALAKKIKEALSGQKNL